MLLNPAGRVFAGERLDNPEPAWQMPQGGIDAGEEPIDAARRECFEETGMESLKLIAEAPDWINYDLPADRIGVVWKGKYRGQTQKWFAFRFHGDEREIRVNPPPGGHKPEFDRWAWRPMADLPGLIVPFKRKVYEEVVRAFGDLAS
jgi:putative (di)nucleoside polyphosphate hydrolase